MFSNQDEALKLERLGGAGSKSRVGGSIVLICLEVTNARWDDVSG